MGLFVKPSRREFRYTPYFHQDPPKDLRERLRFQRVSGLESQIRSSRKWLILAVLTVALIGYLFPEVVTSLWLTPVEIGTEDLRTP